jgi:hypothetical protein
VVKHGEGDVIRRQATSQQFARLAVGMNRLSEAALVLVDDSQEVPELGDRGRSGARGTDRAERLSENLLRSVVLPFAEAAFGLRVSG